MKVALPSGHEAELRDQILAGDKRAANAAIEVHMDSEGGRVVSVSMTDNVKYALLTRLIVSWDVGQPPPSMVVDPVGLLDSLPLDDLDALSDAIDPLYRRIMGIKDDGRQWGGPKSEGHRRQHFTDWFLGRTGAQCPCEPYLVDWFLVAERYHWTPDQYDALPFEFAELLPDMAAGWDAAVKRASESSAHRMNGSQDPGRPRYTGGMAG